MLTVGPSTSLNTVTVTLAAPMLPAPSRAIAVTVCGPLATPVVFHVIPYGATVSGAPAATPSSWNCTLATPTLSVALAAIATTPPTVDRVAGDVIVTAGAVVSLKTVTITDDADVLPEASRANRSEEHTSELQSRLHL